jgi:hypothetical protein
MANKHGIAYFESSAKDNNGVKDIFLSLSQLVIEKQLDEIFMDKRRKKIILEQKKNNFSNYCC